MSSFANVIHTANRLGVFGRIDWSVFEEENAPEAGEWCTILSRLQDAKLALRTISMPTVLNEVDPHSFTNPWHEYDRIVADLSLDSLPAIMRLKDETIPGHRTHSRNVEVPKTFKFEPGVPACLHVIDVEARDIKKSLYIHLYCREVTTGETVLVSVPYKDYFYIQVEPDNGLSFEVVEEAVREVVSDSGKSYDTRLECTSFPSHRDKYIPVTDTERVTDKRSMYGYQPDLQEFVKVYVDSRYGARSLLSILSAEYNGTVVPHADGVMRHKPEMHFYEAKTDVVNKFLTQFGISGCCAIKVIPETVHAHNEHTTCAHYVSTSRVELDADGPIYKPRMLYYDIECLASDINVFPVPEKNEIIQISYLIMDGLDTEIKRGVLCLGETPGSDIYESFEREDQMLIKFAQLIDTYNPDSLTGYNSNGFDMPYILTRMEVLGISALATQFSKRRGFNVSFKRIKKESKQAGARDAVEYKIPGRLMFDQFEVIKADVTKKLLSYSLKSVCEKYLLGGQTKEDLSYRLIPELQKTPEGRARIASYCMQDTMLLLDLDRRLMLGVNLWGQARVLGVTANVALNRGLVFRLMCKLKQYTERYNYLIPTFTDKQRPVFKGKYEGAFVLEPNPAFVKDPVCVLDFASLYPSIMISSNLCYTTIVLDKALLEERPDDFQCCAGEWFVKPSVHDGIIPKLEREMALQRKAAKKKMKEHPDGSLECAMFDSLQLANKVIMNSLYGMLGSPTAQVPCVEIAKTITGMGRQHLINAKEYAEANYQVLTGEPKNCEVIYGDTDSIFIRMPGVSVEKSIEYGKVLQEAAQKALYADLESVDLEYEKVFAPFLIRSAKCYAGKKYVDMKKKPEIKAMGMQLVRRDAAAMCRNLMQAYFDRVLDDGDDEAGAKTIADAMHALMNDQLPREEYVISKKIAKAEYKQTPPHIHSWKKMVKRVGQGAAPAVGERFEYVVTQVPKSKTTGMANAIVDTEKANDDNLPIDRMYYHRTFYVNPLQPVMQLVHGEKRTKDLLDPKNYDSTEVAKPAPGNLLAAWGLGPVTKRVKAHM